MISTNGLGMWWEMLLKTAKEYMSNSSFHGLRFIAQDGAHWTERVFWIVTILLSWYYSSTLIESSWSGYQHNAISFVSDTTYKDWNTGFPSVTICEIKNVEHVQPATEKYWSKVNVNRSYDINLEEILSQITFFNGVGYYVREYCYKGGVYDERMKCPLDNFMEFVENFRGTCDEVFESCKWRDQEFDCCRYFLPLDTEYGLCYSLNNAHINASYHPELHILDTTSNFSTGPGKLSIMLKQNVYMGYFHAPEDMPNLSSHTNSFQLLTPRYPKHIWFSILEVQNDPEVKDTSVEQRKCRFMEENILPSFDKYGIGPCLMECRKREQIKICGCCNHLMPRALPQERCGLEGISCVGENHIHLSVLKNEWNTNENQKGILCPECIASCTEMEIHVTRKMELKLNETRSITRFELALEALPTERPKRIVVRGKLDLVVSMGGAAGLLVGASLLSFVEFFYFFTLRLYGNLKAEKEIAEQKRKPPMRAANFRFGDLEREYF